MKPKPNREGFEVLRSLDLADGVGPHAGLVVAGSTLYGTASSFGSSRYGTVFKLNTDGGGFTVLKSFTGLNDGGEPYAGLTLPGTTLYGTTARGGSNRWGTVFRIGTDGGGFTVLKHFTGGAGGQYPNAVLALSGATLYGTVQEGGAAGLGAVFKVNTDGTAFAVLQHFSSADGSRPDGGLILAGTRLFGTTSAGGALDAGVVFSLSLGPSLRLARPTANTIRLSWPYPSEGFSLQQNANLGTTDWTSVSTPPVQVGDEWQVHLPLSPGHRFYRLRKP